MEVEKKKIIGAKASFQRQLHLVGHKNEYKRFREIVRYMVFAIFDPKVSVGRQNPESWVIFRQELKRLFGAFRDEARSPKLIHSSIKLAKECIHDYPRGRLKERVPRIVIKSRAELNKLVEMMEGRPNKISIGGSTYLLKAPAQSRSSPFPVTSGVLSFLEGCNPSMKALLPEFIEAGIIDSDSLLTMAKRWPRSCLHSFLEQFGRQEDGSPNEDIIQTLLDQFDELLDEEAVQSLLEI
ncbi:hypothetical protein C8R43DRAFT_942653 [Mycena crocata]|nr:hypothetical protein C8R43DRAFT_942653 [Mycena crocata]